MYHGTGFVIRFSPIYERPQCPLCYCEHQFDQSSSNSPDFVVTKT